MKKNENKNNFRKDLNQKNKLFICNEKNIINKDEHKNIQYAINLIYDSYSFHFLDKTFCTFKSNEDIYYIIYSDREKSIIFYNLIDNKKINEIKNAHQDYISNLIYYFDILNNRDLIMSISINSNIKIWNINLECIINIENIYKNDYLISGCLLNNNNENYIITCNYDKTESIKVFDFNGNKIKEINYSNYEIVFIDVYKDNKLSKNYILIGSKGKSISYDFNKNNIYHKYNDNNQSKSNEHYNIIINDKEKIIKLIESTCYSQINI